MRLRLLLVATLAVFATFAIAPGARAQAAPPDYADYQALLTQYMVRVSAKGQPLETRFDYEQLYVDEKIWTRHSSARLTALHEQLVNVPYQSLAPRDRVAWAINTYNYLILERATMDLLIPGRTYTRFRSVDHMFSSNTGRFWLGEAVRIGGKAYTIPAFERRFVWGDTIELGLRTVAGDPRVIFALCAGHTGDAPLQPRAFRGDSLEAQLDAAARGALELPRFINVDTGGTGMGANQCFADHLVDFGGQSSAIVAFLARYGPAPVRNAIKRSPQIPIRRYLPTDRLLNQWDRPKPKAPTSS